MEDPYIHVTHQIQHFVRFCETLITYGQVQYISLTTSFEDESQKQEVVERFSEIKQSLMEMDIVFEYQFNDKIHDREVRFDNGWLVKIGRGLDYFQKPSTWFEIGANDLNLRKCLETKVDIFKQVGKD